MKGRIIAALAAGLLLASVPGRAQDTVYKCAARGGVTYSDRLCSGARPLGAEGKRSTSRKTVPPQDRAHRMKRAQLQPEVRRECERLDVELKEQQAFVRTRGAAVTPEEERPLVQAKLRYRQLRC